MSGGETQNYQFRELNFLLQRNVQSTPRCSVRKLDRGLADGHAIAYVSLSSRIFYRRTDIDSFVAAHVRGNVGVAKSVPGLSSTRSGRVGTAGGGAGDS